MLARLRLCTFCSLAILSAASALADDRPTVTIDGPAVVESGAALGLKVVLTNATAAPLKANVEFSVQSDPNYFAGQAPDPVFGSDRALGAKSWTLADGKTIEEGSLTDGKDWTSASTDWRGQHWSETSQYVDLGKSLRVTRIGWLSGDANWVAKVDVSASADGKTYAPVESLQDVDLYHKWGPNVMPLKEPFEARFLQLRYHDDVGKKPADVIRMPSALSVYDGVADETFEVPTVGPVLLKATRTIAAAPGQTEKVSIGDGRTKVSCGAYFVVAKVKSANQTNLVFQHVLVLPELLKSVSRSSRFGLNASDPKMVAVNRRLGVGWVRFENFKWPMVSPEPGVYRFDGTVGPWFVNHDQIIGDYSATGITVLPFLFQTAFYATSAPPSVTDQGRQMSYPPKDDGAFAEFCYQAAARYGATQHVGADLKTVDQVSGKGQVPVYEIWNEPNLTDPGWGPWVGTAEQYLTMFRAAAEAVKRADPKALVTNGGYAGITTGTIGEMTTFKYPDGKRPVDFVDVLNVHYYSGRVAPEVATIDTNVERKNGGGGGTAGTPTYEEHLKRLTAWRDANKPGLPIWLTETGYDSAGPFGTDERTQAARLPRTVMTALAAGVDKVFVYREKGSEPSMHAASGLVREDGSVKPSYLTYGTTIRMLDGMTRCDRVAHPDPNVRLYLWRKAKDNDGAVLTAWAVEEEDRDKPATLGLELGKLGFVDAFGAWRDVSVTRSTPLSIFPVYITGVDVGKLPITAGR